MNSTYDANTNILTVHIPLLRTPEPNAKGTLMVAKISGQKFGAANADGKPFVGNVQIWLGK